MFRYRLEEASTYILDFRLNGRHAFSVPNSIVGLSLLEQLLYSWALTLVVVVQNILKSASRVNYKAFSPLLQVQETTETSNPSSLRD